MDQGMEAVYLVLSVLLDDELWYLCGFREPCRVNWSSCFRDWVILPTTSNSIFREPPVKDSRKHIIGLTNASLFTLDTQILSDRDKCECGRSLRQESISRLTLMTHFIYHPVQDLICQKSIQCSVSTILLLGIKVAAFQLTFGKLYIEGKYFCLDTALFSVS